MTKTDIGVSITGKFSVYGLCLYIIVMLKKKILEQSTSNCWNILTDVFAGLPCRMERSESSSSSVFVTVPDRDMVRPSGQLSEPARPSKNREHPSKSPRRRRKGTRLQQRGGDHEQLLWEIERRRLPGQHEHLEPSGSASDPAESSPKRFALQAASWSAMPLVPLRCPGCEVMVSWLVLLFFYPPFSQESPLSTWTVSSHSLRTQSVHSSQPDVSHVSEMVPIELFFVCTNRQLGTLTQRSLCNLVR